MLQNISGSLSIGVDAVTCQAVNQRSRLRRRALQIEGAYSTFQHRNNGRSNCRRVFAMQTLQLWEKFLVALTDKYLHNIVLHLAILAPDNTARHLDIVTPELHECFVVYVPHKYCTTLTSQVGQLLPVELLHKLAERIFGSGNVGSGDGFLFLYGKVFAP